MLRFTIRDVLWLTVVAALGVALWVNQRQHRAEMAKLAEEARQLRRAGDLWERRAESLRRDVVAGRQFGEVEFIPHGLRYGRRVKAQTAVIEAKTEPRP